MFLGSDLIEILMKSTMKFTNYSKFTTQVQSLVLSAQLRINKKKQRK